MALTFILRLSLYHSDLYVTTFIRDRHKHTLEHTHPSGIRLWVDFLGFLLQ